MERFCRHSGLPAFRGVYTMADEGGADTLELRLMEGVRLVAEGELREEILLPPARELESE